MKIKKLRIAGFIVWLFAMVSIIFAPQIRNLTATKNQKASVEAQKYLVRYKAAFDLLTEEEKFDVVIAKKGLLMLRGELGLIGIGDEPKLLRMAKEGKIVHLNFAYELAPIDAEILKQSTEKKMVRQQLPVFQKKLVQSHKAVLLRDSNGQFFMVAGKQEALEYQKKYGTECESCGSK